MTEKAAHTDYPHEIGCLYCGMKPHAEQDKQIQGNDNLKGFCSSPLHFMRHSYMIALDCK
jgi:hypothetical protein